jgi:hypothetical protein
MNTRNPIWADPEHNAINCEIDHPIYGWIPFTASLSDQYDYSVNLFNSCLEKGVAEYVTPSVEEMKFIVRQKRNNMLRLSDWSQAEDVPRPIKTAWQIYRQELRDIPLQNGFPNDVKFPVTPN